MTYRNPALLELAKKRCGVCKETKSANEFYPKATHKDGLRWECKFCSNEQCKNYAKQQDPKIRKARQKKWRDRHPEAVKAMAERNRRKYAEKRRISQRRYAKDHPEEMKRRVKEWIAKNPARHRALCMRAWNKRRAAKLNAVPKWADHEAIKQIYTEAARKNSGTRKYHVDHIVPLQSPLVCGLHVHNNLRVVPWMENTKKANRFWPDMP